MRLRSTPSSHYSTYSTFIAVRIRDVRVFDVVDDGSLVRVEDFDKWAQILQSYVFFFFLVSESRSTLTSITRPILAALFLKLEWN